MFPEKISVSKGEGHFNIAMGPMNAKMTPALTRRSNKVDFRKGNKCTHCNVVAKHIECLARKYVENDRCHKIMTVIYIGTHDCNPRATENKPSKESIEEYLKTRPTNTTRQLQVDKVTEALLSGKAADEVVTLPLNSVTRGTYNISRQQSIKLTD